MLYVGGRGLGTLGMAQRLTWDFRKGPHNIAEVNWPTSITGRDWDVKGQFDLTIIGSKGDIIFHEDVQHIICRRNGDKLEAVFLHFGSGCTAEQAYQTVKKIMTDWKYPQDELSGLEVWHDAISRRVSYEKFIKLHEHDHDSYGLVFQYPGFEAGKAGDVGLRLSETNGTPEKGDLSYTISISF
jgi:hypothetical protein